MNSVIELKSIDISCHKLHVSLSNINSISNNKLKCHDSGKQQKRRGKEKNPEVGTGEQQAASGVQQGRVDIGDAGNNGNDQTGN